MSLGICQELALCPWDQGSHSNSELCGIPLPGGSSGTRIPGAPTLAADTPEDRYLVLCPLCVPELSSHTHSSGGRGSSDLESPLHY